VSALQARRAQLAPLLPATQAKPAGQVLSLVQGSPWQRPLLHTSPVAHSVSDWQPVVHSVAPGVHAHSMGWQMSPGLQSVSLAQVAGPGLQAPQPAEPPGTTHRPPLVLQSASVLQPGGGGQGMAVQAMAGSPGPWQPEKLGPPLQLGQ
jgi:hypothetical protein